MQNARWFTRIRWVVVFALAFFGLLGVTLPRALTSVGLIPCTSWPWFFAGIISVINLLMIASLRWLTNEGSRRAVAATIWIQIIADLLVLTILIYFAGFTDSVIVFAYLFHTALACIFFAPRQSFLVTLMSAAFFLSIVGLEYGGILPHRTILVRGLSKSPDLLASASFALPTVFVWFVVWYLMSTLSHAVRLRDRELAAANNRLLKADEEKNLQVLRVAHDLKAPFSGIEVNIHMLRLNHWSELSEAAREIVSKIEARSATLRARTRDLLMLGELRASGFAQAKPEPVELAALLASIIEELHGLAESRRVQVILNNQMATVSSDRKQMHILFSNLIANAISYSRMEGVVDVSVGLDRDVRVRVQDHGIGISDEALPHIFEDFFRTEEAAECNPQSTGLGLAIVRQVAQNLGLMVVVQSEPGRGSMFEVVIPRGKETE